MWVKSVFKHTLNEITRIITFVLWQPTFVGFCSKLVFSSSLVNTLLQVVLFPNNFFVIVFKQCVGVAWEHKEILTECHDSVFQFFKLLLSVGFIRFQKREQISWRQNTHQLCLITHHLYAILSPLQVAEYWNREYS